MLPKRPLAALIILAASTQAYANHNGVSHHEPIQSVALTNLEVSISAARFNTDIATINGEMTSFDNDVAMLTVGYAIKNERGHMSFTPELSYAEDFRSAPLRNSFIQLTEDAPILPGGPGYELEYNHMVSIGTRITVHPNDMFYVYIKPTYTHFKMDIHGPGDNINVKSEWELGGSVGIGMYLTKHFSISGSVERYSDIDAASLNARYHF
jgi:hypothetical protein